MYLAPIVRNRPAVSPLKRRLVGAPVLLLAATVIIPWLAFNAAVSGVVVGVMALGGGPRALLQAIDYAGEIPLSR